MALEGTSHIDEETTYQILLKNRADFFSHRLNHSWHLESVYSLSLWMKSDVIRGATRQTIQKGVWLFCDPSAGQRIKNSLWLFCDRRVGKIIVVNGMWFRCGQLAGKNF